MRPCNQCGHPVENSILVCDDCKAWNAANAPEESTTEDAPDNSNDFYADHSYTILMGIFCLIITALFALVGLAVNDTPGFLIGGVAGILVGATMFTVMIRM